MKHIEISVMEDGELSIDGQVKPAGNLDKIGRAHV